MTTIWIVDNRVRRRGIKVSMTNRLIQALRVFSEDVRVIRNANEARRIRYGVVILSGSSMSVANGDVSKAQVALTAITIALQRGLPILGICFGFQILAFVHGLRVSRLPETIRCERRVEDCGIVYFHHQDVVEVNGELLSGKVFVDRPRVQGVQFHPEATDDGHAWLFHWIRSAAAAS